MNLKLRFALLFTSFVAIILLIATASIYFLYASYRSEDYYNRVISEGNEVYRVYNELKKPDRAVTAELVRGVHDIALFNEELFIVNAAGNTVFKFPVSAKTTPVVVRQKFSKDNKYSFTDDNNIQHIVIYKPESGLSVYISGYDRIGYNKLSTLKIILLSVYLGALLLTAVMSFLFVQQAIKPILRLSLQMQRTNEQNLSDRIEVKPANDEINSIAKNFNAMLERLRKAFESQKSFVHHASHELRTPLAVMLSQTEAALSRSYDTEGYRKILFSLKEDQQQMVELTNSLLLISQYETLEYFEGWPFIRIDEILYETVSRSQRMYPDLQIGLNFERIPSDDADLLVKANESLLRSAAMNLIKNAYAYSTDRVVQIRLVPDNGMVCIYIENKGPQLSAEEVEKMKIPFFRGENSLKKKGFGLGLSIIDRIVTLHKGKVNYIAGDNEMNTFIVSLPSQTA